MRTGSRPIRSARWRRSHRQPFGRGEIADVEAEIPGRAAIGQRARPAPGSARIPQEQRPALPFSFRSACLPEAQFATPCRYLRLLFHMTVSGPRTLIRSNAQILRGAWTGSHGFARFMLLRTKVRAPANPHRIQVKVA